MSRTARLSVRARVGIGFTGVSAVFVVFAFVVLSAMNRTQERFRTVYADRVVVLEQLATLKTDLTAAQRIVADPLTPAPTVEREVRRLLVGADSIWQAYLSTYLTPEEAKIAEAQKAEFATAKTALLDAVAFRQSATTPEAALQRGAEIAAPIASSLARFDQLVDLQVRVSLQELNASAAAVDRSRIIAWLLGALVLALSGFTAYRLMSDIGSTVAAVQQRADSLVSHCISGLQHASKAMAAGDFSVKVEPRTTLLKLDRSDELGRLADSIDRITSQTQETVTSFTVTQHEIQKIVTRVRALADAMRAGDLSHRIPTAGLQGELLALAEAMNSALDGVVQPMLDANDEFGRVLREMAVGNLAIRVTGQYHGAQGKIAERLNETLAALDTTIRDVAAAAEEISVAGTQIAAGAEISADAATTQAGQLQEITANASVQRETSASVASEAASARALTEAAHDASMTGRASLGALADALSRIRTTAEATSRVVRTIDEIAFQTNLLALNAAVEAARAGDAGRGFAVVAEEVRALATRSSEAARQTADLIEQSLGAVEQGASLGEDAVSGIAVVDSRIAELTSTIQRVADAAQVQQTSISSVVSSLEMISDLTTQSAATAQETSAGAEELRSQSALLRERTATFVVSKEAPLRSVPDAAGRRTPLSVPSLSAGRPNRPARSRFGD
jgi:methyl-accepting chemotaxis protein